MNEQNSQEAAIPAWTALKWIGGFAALYSGLMMIFAQVFYSAI
ncbi:MAG: hypothetical protein ACN6NX_03720 [Acinetobacter sp.]